MASAPVGRQELIAYLRGVRILADPIDGRALVDARPELEAYVEMHARAVRLSLAMLRRHLPAGRRVRVLELGGAPYFFSAVMRWAFDAELTAVNVQAGAWPGEPVAVDRGKVVLAVPEDGKQGRMEIEVRVLNIEKDALPFPAGSFDVVLCMEIIEHLGYSPSHMLAESHRVLTDEGLLFITVPNLVNIKRTVNMVLNRPTEFPYSGYGIYGRHQREFAPGELARLLADCHYRIAELRTANVWPAFRDSAVKGLGNWLLNALTALPLPWLSSKREYVLCAAQPQGEPVAAYPGWLYTHRHLYPEPPHGVRKVLVE